MCDFTIELDFGGEDVEEIGVDILKVYPGCPGSDVEPPGPPEADFEVDTERELTWEQYRYIEDQCLEHASRRYTDEP